MAHARLSPSNKRWPHCPGSVREEAVYPDSAGESAIDGTGTHLLVDMCIDLPNCNNMLGKTIGVGHPDKPEGWLVEKDRIERANMMLAYVQRRVKELGGATVLSESKADPGELYGRNDWHGTCDVTLDGVVQRTLEVIDYKDGFQFVAAVDNSQLLSYLGGKLKPYVMNGATIPNYDDTGLAGVRMTIVQPKSFPPIRYQDMTVREAMEKVDQLAVAAKKTDDPDAPLIPGSWCEWCKHGKAGNCTAKNSQAMEGLSFMANLPTTTGGDGKSTLLDMIQSGKVATATMDDATIANVLDAAPLITALLKQVEDEAIKRMQAGTYADPRYTLDNKDTREKWALDDEEIAKKLKGMRFTKDEIYPPKLCTPAQALKKEGLTERQIKNMKTELITKPKGDPKVVKAQQLLEKDASQMFMDVPATGQPATPPAPATGQPSFLQPSTTTPAPPAPAGLSFL